MASHTPAEQQSITAYLESEYKKYLAAQDRGDVAGVEAFMSPSCWQISRQDPAWNLKDRADIMRILTSMGLGSGSNGRKPGTVDIRALTPEEKGTVPQTDKEKAALEGWEGLHVVLEDADPDGLLVKVNYYWRQEDGIWVQCLHDLLWVGPKNAGSGNDIGAAVFGKK